MRTDPSLEKLSDAYPQLWASVRDEIADVLARNDIDALTAMTVAANTASSRRRARSRHEAHQLITAAIRRQMANEALARVRFALSTGVSEGTVRFSWLNGTILQRLLFSTDLERKPASARWFRLLWPLLPQRRRLMALVQPKGIYCFYTAELIRELSRVIGTASCLEIAAGDGTLTRFLRDHGVTITATDDHSWSERVSFPDFVQRQDAVTALRVHQPEVVICSWPPAANRFERAVFNTPSVHTYIVISTHHEPNASDRCAYRTQRHFELDQRTDLDRLVLPPELDHAVYVFRRRGAER